MIFDNDLYEGMTAGKMIPSARLRDDIRNCYRQNGTTFSEPGYWPKETGRANDSAIWRCDRAKVADDDTPDPESDFRQRRYAALEELYRRCREGQPVDPAKLDEKFEPLEDAETASQNETRERGCPASADEFERYRTSRGLDGWPDARVRQYLAFERQYAASLRGGN
jgi:hypothetical protein